MSAGPKYVVPISFHLLTHLRYEYLWADGVKIKKPVNCSAPQYVDYLMTWVQEQLDDESIFPSKVDVPFPKNFETVVKTIFKKMFRYHEAIQYFSSNFLTLLESMLICITLISHKLFPLVKKPI